MYIYEIDWKIFEKCLRENEYVILGVLSDDLVLNNFFKACLNKLNKKLNNNIVIGTMDLSIYQSRKAFDSITPRINLYKNNKLVKEVFGLKKCDKILEELGISNLLKKIA